MNVFLNYYLYSRAQCCGAYHVVHMKDVAAQLSNRILHQASEAGADIIATSCPLCEFYLGNRQKVMQKLFFKLQRDSSCILYSAYYPCI